MASNLSAVIVAIDIILVVKDLMENKKHLNIVFDFEVILN